MKENQESQSTTLGPFASLGASGQIEWVQFTIDRTGKVEQFKTATAAQFVRHEWQMDRPVPQKLSVYAPETEKSEICFVFAPLKLAEFAEIDSLPELIRFYFVPPRKGETKWKPWLGEPFHGESFRNASIRPKEKGLDITSDDRWYPDEDQLRQITSQYAEWKKHTPQALFADENEYFDFMHDDEGNEKTLPPSKLSPVQRAHIQQIVLSDWSRLKASLRHSKKEYCHALKLLLSPTLLSEDLASVSPEVSDRIIEAQQWFLPVVINKLPVKKLYENDAPEISIGDVQDYLQDLIIEEIKQYFPEHVPDKFDPDAHLKSTRIGEMKDELGQLLFNITAGMSVENQQEVLQLRQLMSGNADHLNLADAERLLNIVTNIEQRNVETQAIEADLVQIHAASGHTAFDRDLSRLKTQLEEHIQRLKAGFWIRSLAEAHCPQLDLSQFDNDMSLLVEIYQTLITDTTPQSEQDALLAKIIEHTRHQYLNPWENDSLVKVVLSRTHSLTTETFSNLLEYWLSNRTSELFTYEYGYLLGRLIKDLSLEKSKLIIDKVRLEDPDFFRQNNLKKLKTYADLGLTQEQMNLILDAWDIYNMQVISFDDVSTLMEVYPDLKKEELYQQEKESINEASSHNFQVFLKYMAIIPEQHREAFYNQHGYLIENSMDDHVVFTSLKALPDPYRARYLQVVMPRIPSMLPKNGLEEACKRIFEFLSLEQRSAVFQSIKPALTDAFKKYWRNHYSSKDLNFLEYFSRAQCIEFLKPLERTRFSSRFMSPLNLGKNLYHLSEEKCRIVCETWKPSIIAKLKSANDINLLFKTVSTEDSFFSRGNPPKRRLDLCPILYDILKEKIVSTPYPEDQYSQLQEYLTLDEQLDLSHRMTLHKLQPWLPSQRLEVFKTALMDDESTIKVAFDALFKPKYTMQSIFRGNTQANANLIQIIADAENGWLNKINRALSLNLAVEQLTDPTAVKSALEQYVSALANINQTPHP